jgi:hypothetical protein
MQVHLAQWQKYTTKLSKDKLAASAPSVGQIYPLQLSKGSESSANVLVELCVLYPVSQELNLP